MKVQLEATGQIPGMPQMYLESGEENPEAVRYASQYLGHKSGYLPEALVKMGNVIALKDFMRSEEEAEAIKNAGRRGAEAAIIERPRYSMYAGGALRRGPVTLGTIMGAVR